MADETKMREILLSAREQGLLKVGVGNNLCFTGTLNSANKILLAIKNNGGDIDVKQLSWRMNFNDNTTRIFLRLLTELDFLKSHPKEDMKNEFIWSLKE